VIRSAAWCACVALLLGARIAAAAPTGDSVSLSLLTYNIHGLFWGVAKDDLPRDRMPTIGRLSNQYDVVLYQEDFEYHDVLRKQLGRYTSFRGSGLGYDPRRVLMKALMTPFALVVPRFSAPYGAGVSALVRSDWAAPDDVDRGDYGSCHRWFGSRGDCWANKGWLRVGIQPGNGVPVDLYTTHLDAGPGTSSQRVRRRQLRRLADAIERLSAGRAVIVAGDLNLSIKRSLDEVSMREFRERLGLLKSGVASELAIWNRRDCIIYRDGPQTTLELESAGRATEFVRDARALSDHAALYARFRIHGAPPSPGSSS
jgi:endonuclease/exonuclease/phosphatase family metal-dependent hydrolase